jgi:hypothetical protein
MESDFVVSSYTSEFLAIGTGQDLAMDSLYSTGRVQPNIPVKTRLNIALECAANYGQNIREPFDVLAL